MNTALARGEWERITLHDAFLEVFEIDCVARTVRAVFRSAPAYRAGSDDPDGEVDLVLGADQFDWVTLRDVGDLDTAVFGAVTRRGVAVPLTELLDGSPVDIDDAELVLSPRGAITFRAARAHAHVAREPVSPAPGRALSLPPSLPRSTLAVTRIRLQTRERRSTAVITLLVLEGDRRGTQLDVHATGNERLDIHRLRPPFECHRVVLRDSDGSACDVRDAVGKRFSSAECSLSMRAYSSGVLEADDIEVCVSEPVASATDEIR